MVDEDGRLIDFWRRGGIKRGDEKYFCDCLWRAEDTGSVFSDKMLIRKDNEGCSFCHHVVMRRGDERCCCDHLVRKDLLTKFLLVTWLETVVLIFNGDQVVRSKGDEDNFAVT
jgi:hypothetical protein